METAEHAKLSATAALVRNPLSVIAIFVLLVEAIATIPLITVSARETAVPLVWFVVSFPTIVAILFFSTLWWGHQRLYSPMEYRSDEFFLTAMTAEAVATKAAIAQTSTDSSFDKVSYLLDWNIFSAEVRKWAQRNDAPDASNMGPNNFARMLYEYGLPGGKPIELRWKNEGDRRVLEYQ